MPEVALATGTRVVVSDVTAQGAAELAQRVAEVLRQSSATDGAG
ncbi:hypothetical protein ACQEV4_04880 [Streptomyces shenzhenensis]